MYKLFFRLLLLASLMNISLLQAQSTVFLNQLKTIINAGEKGELAKMKGGLIESTRDKEEQFRVYYCLQPLDGFDINFQESKNEFSLFIVSRSADSVRKGIDDLLNNEIRERSGITGYTVSQVPGTTTNSVIRQKTGSPVSITIHRPDSKTLIAISIEVTKTMAAPEPEGKKIIPPAIEKDNPAAVPLFLRQLKTILEESRLGMARHKVKLTYTNVNGKKYYTCNLKLEGFKTYVIDNGEGMTFIAEADNYKLSAINAKKFIDKKQRETAGILGYTTTFTVLKAGNIFSADEVTKFDKAGSFLFIRVYKNWFDRGYRIEIEEMVME
jgi:hypothetical protein